MKHPLLLIAAILMGCASPPATYTKIAPPAENFARLIVYRLEGGPGSFWTKSFYVNEDTELPSLRQGDYVAVDLSASGKRHAIRSESPTSSHVVYIEPKPGRTYFVRYSTRLGSMIFAGGIPIVSGQSEITEVAEEVAAEEMRGYFQRSGGVRRVE